MSERHVEKIKRLRKVRETWQGGIIRIPQWLAEEGRAPIRPWMAVWVSLGSGRVNTSEPKRPAEKEPGMLLEAMGAGQGMPSVRPERVEVADAGLAEYLRPILAQLEMEVDLVEASPALDAVVAHMRKHVSQTVAIPPDASTAEGVTVDRMRAFAEAAAELYRMAPWQYLTDEDLVRVESPTPADARLTHFTVMGAAGMAFGLGFFRSRDQHEELERTTDMRKFYRKHGGLWTVMFNEITHQPFGDADWFEDHDLPVGGPKGYPLVKKYDGSDGTQERPDAPTLAYLEGLMRALAATGEDEMDRGAWTKKVRTFDGEAEYVLALSQLLEDAPPAASPNTPTLAQIRSMERALDRLQRVNFNQEFETEEEAKQFLEQVQSATASTSEPATPLQRAQELVDRASETRGRRSRQLIRKALEVCPDCADAYLHLAYRERDLNKAFGLFTKAVEAGRSAIGDAALEEGGGNFWRQPAARPYLRARMGLAECLRALGRVPEAVEHFKEMIRLNPEDKAGARYRLMACLLELDRNDELQDLFQRFDGDRAALWAYGRALWMYRREKDTGNSRKEMMAALEANHFAPNYLMKKKDLPAQPPPSYTPGSEAEGIVIGLELRGAWEATEGAVWWLGDQKRRKKERDERKRNDR